MKKIALYLQQKIRANDLDSIHEREITLISSSSGKDRETLQPKSGPLESLGSVKANPIPNLMEFKENMPTDEPQSRWIEYDLTNLLQDRLTTGSSVGRRSGGNFVTVNANLFKIYSSFITIDYNERQVSRKKRSLDCDAAAKTSICCREHFYVNFTHIGWDNWILQPSGYSANYCKGMHSIHLQQMNILDFGL